MLKNFYIQDCVFTDPFYHLSVIEVSCNRTREDDIVLEMHNVEFTNNSNPGGIAGFRVQEPSCVEVRMRGFRFIENQYHLGSVFGHQNDLEDTIVGENVQWLQPPAINNTAFDERVSQRIPHTNDPDDDVLEYDPLWCKRVCERRSIVGSMNLPMTMPRRMRWGTLCSAFPERPKAP